MYDLSNLLIKHIVFNKITFFISWFLILQNQYYVHMAWNTVFIINIVHFQFCWFKQVKKCSVIVIWIFRGKFKLCIFTKHLLLIINLHELQAYKFVKFSDLAKNWYFCTPIIVIFSVAHPLIQKLLIYEQSSWNALNICSNKNLIGGSLWKLKISTQKSHFGDDTIYEVIMQELVWKWHH